MPSKKLLLALLFLSILGTLAAHEFWLSPAKYIYKRGEKINIRFFTGKNFEGESWNAHKEEIQSLKIFYGGVEDDLSDYFGDNPGDSLTLTMLDEGTSLVAFHSTNTFVDLPAERFNNYLITEGLAEVYDYRKKNNHLDSSGKELFQRCAKTLIQVGHVKTKTYAEEVGLPLEIIPLSNPYQLKHKENLPVRIIFKKQPLVNSFVKVWHKEKNENLVSLFTTDENGTINIPVLTTGYWMISIVKMEKLDLDNKAQWQSYWGSFTWGYQ